MVPFGYRRTLTMAPAIAALIAVIDIAPVCAESATQPAIPTATASVPDTPLPVKPRRTAPRLAALPAVGTRDPAGYQINSDIASWYHERGASEPVTDHPVYCHGYGCEFQTPIEIDDADIATLRRIFAGHSATAADERAAISEAVRWWERHASPLLGGPPRKHGSDIGHAHHPGQTDCIDEATNTTSILVFLERRGFLLHHKVERPQSRGIIVNAHSTAIIRADDGVEWAVDMWMHDMGEAPDIMTETQWMSEA